MKEEWSGGEGSSDRDKGKGGVQSKVPVPGPFSEIQEVEQLQGGGISHCRHGEDGVEYGEFAGLHTDDGGDVYIQ